MKVLHKTTRLSPLLKFAIKAGVLDSVKAQIEKTDCINSRDSSDITPLMLACIYTQEQICQYLLEQQADISLRDVNGKTALDHARENGAQQIIALLQPPSSEPDPCNSQFFESADEVPALFLPSLEVNLNQASSYGTIRYPRGETSTERTGKGVSLTVQSEILSYRTEPTYSEASDAFGWEAEEVITRPENDVTCFSEAEKLQEIISSHRPIDRDEDWSMLEITLPSLSLPAQFLRDDMPAIRRIFFQGLVEGVLGLSHIASAVEQDFDEESAESALGIVTSMLGDAGVAIEGYRPGFHEHPVDLTDALEAQLDEILSDLQNELSGELYSLHIQRERFREFDLIDRNEEERIGQQMDSALRALIVTMAELPERDWEKVAVFLSDKVVATEEGLITEETEEKGTSGQEEEQEEYLPEDSPETASFQELVQGIRNNPDQDIESGYIVRPQSHFLDMLTGYAESKPEKADSRRILRLIENFKKAQHKLIHSNFRLVDHIARRYTLANVPIEDLVQEGCLGLMKAAERYNYHLGFKFSTYATWWIKQSITRAIADQGRTIRIPVHMGEIINSVERARRELVKQGQRVTVNALAEKSEHTYEQVYRALNANINVVSMGEITPDYEDEPGMAEFLCSDAYSPERYTFELDLKKAVNLMLVDLNPREREVIKLRFGLENGLDMTLEEVGSRFEVTRERIRQIEAKALRALRHPSRIGILEPFIDFALPKDKQQGENLELNKGAI
ncbi:hypothetical protein BKE30_02915 [Alkanindiges hydrocarboniclasticus]|uniref:RNA polymerase sigma factor n=1 Tax=Alkanindiges hydrocarboniclasticus TaxID=1907941 RepID=A0A1S8CY85_9GAMM|nr:MZA anti-phage system associated sigma-70 family RNA polymerase sigma factor MzaA [Alkanindiges hydrocarboniclasticus]ONG41803.1 hypothetical protein BKE30_02915 [Alkanindiges hydrocarboniclasticus]